jgi:hypothetical protein
MLEVLIALANSRKPFVGYIVEKQDVSDTVRLCEDTQIRCDRIAETFGLSSCLLLSSNVILIEGDQPGENDGLIWKTRKEALTSIPKLLEEEGDAASPSEITGYEITAKDIANLYALKNGKTDEVDDSDLSWLKEAGLVGASNKPLVDPDEIK